MFCVSNQHKPINCTISLPQSKSILNRLLVINHLSGGEFVTGLEAEAQDVVTMQLLLQVIKEWAGQSATRIEINVGNAGTVMRFLTAVLAVTDGNWIITGTERMQQRPVQPLTDALKNLGAELLFEKKQGYPPVLIQGNNSLRGGTVTPDAGISSQFISALMMIGPSLKSDLTIDLQGNVISGSYIRMTQALMQKAGAKISFSGNRIEIREGKYRNFDFNEYTEPDWSAAAFWYQVAAFSADTQVLLKGLASGSVQGDSVLPEIYTNLGVKSVFTNEGLQLTKSEHSLVKEFNYDFTECPDLAQAVIVSCAALGIKGCFSGLKTLRVKETDRISALRNELTKLGYLIEVVENDIILDGKSLPLAKGARAIEIKCYDDHRMAMSFATLALLRDDICLDEPGVVKKSYPGFWRDMEKVGIVIM